MMNKIEIPKDVTVLCEQVAKGYERRKKDYERRRADIMFRAGSGCFSEFVGASRSTGSTSDPTAVKAERLESLDNSLDVKLIRAVDEALYLITTGVMRDYREKLCKAILLNCEDGREFPFEVLGLDGFSRAEFYRRKKRFIAGIGVVLGLVE